VAVVVGDAVQIVVCHVSAVVAEGVVGGRRGRRDVEPRDDGGGIGGRGGSRNVRGTVAVVVVVRHTVAIGT
jgi:hypothetical protein